MTITKRAFIFSSLRGRMCFLLMAIVGNGKVTVRWGNVECLTDAKVGGKIECEVYVTV